jgi:serine/threonine-protein kinase
MTRAEHEEREGRRDLACKDYRSVADANPADPRSAFETALSCGLFSGRGGGPTLARPYYHRAWDQRASLAPVDVAILDALEPILLRDPWDQKEALNRLKLLTRDFPDDARAHTLLARALSWFNDSKGEFDELARSLALDPNQPHTLYFEADHLAYNGEFDRARAAIARCLRLAATSLECLREEARIDGELGSCDHVEADARQMLAVEASSADAEQILANALYAQGSGLPALREVLARKRESMPVDERAESERADEVRLAVLSGDLSKADGLAQAASEAVAASAFASDHGAAARRVVMIEEELGRSSEAAKAASKYLEGRDGWQADTTFEDCLVSRTCG